MLRNTLTNTVEEQDRHKLSLDIQAHHKEEHKKMQIEEKREKGLLKKWNVLNLNLNNVIQTDR